MLNHRDSAGNNYPPHRQENEMIRIPISGKKITCSNCKEDVSLHGDVCYLRGICLLPGASQSESRKAIEHGMKFHSKVCVKCHDLASAWRKQIIFAMDNSFLGNLPVKGGKENSTL